MKKLSLLLSLLAALAPSFAPAAPVKLNIYGDSILDGISAANPVFEVVIRSHYVNQDVGVFNLAKSGATAADMDAVVLQYVGSGQTCALILIGTNDIAQGTSPSTIASTVRTSVQRLLDSGIQNVFIGTLLPRGGAGYGSGSLANLLAFNELVKDIPTELDDDRVIVIDFHDGMGEPGFPNNLLEVANFGDGLHVKEYDEMWEIFRDGTAGHLPVPTTP